MTPSTHTVLLVEDDPDHALLETEALESVEGRSVHVHVAADGQAALDYLFRAPGFEGVPTPDLVLLDVRMPVVDGFEVLARIKEDETLRVIPVVMLTSSDAAADVARSYGLGSNSYVTKPVDGQAIQDRVGGVLRYWCGVNTPPPEEREAA